MFYDKKSLKDCHKLCIIYIIFSPDPDKEIWDSSEGDWVSDKKIFHISIKIFDTFSQGGGEGGGGGGEGGFGGGS